MSDLVEEWKNFVGYTETKLQCQGCEHAKETECKHVDRMWVCAHPHDQGEFSRSIDAEVALLPELCRGLWGPANFARAIRVSPRIPNRTHRFECLGNAVLPVIPEAYGKAINNIIS